MLENSIKYFKLKIGKYGLFFNTNIFGYINCVCLKNTILICKYIYIYINKKKNIPLFIILSKKKKKLKNKFNCQYENKYSNNDGLNGKWT